MNKKILIVISLIASVSFGQNLDQKIKNLISQMTLAEKIKQLHQEGGFNTADNIRLKIPGFVMADGPHGVRDGLATAFPVGISMAATWDRDLIFRVGVAMGKEFKGKGKHQALGPCLDLTKDPRNGRSAESGGEDPFLDAQITTALLKGIQTTGVIATAKHFNLDSKQNGRFTNDYTVNKRNLMEHLGLNYKTAIQDGGVLSIMNAYNLVNGQKCAENPELLTNILRTYWGFPFYVVSDWGSIWSVKNAILAGCNIEMGSTLYERDLLNLVNTGEIPEAIIDDALEKVLRTKYASGMMNYYPSGNPDDVNSIDHQKLCLEAGKKSLILLKNQDNILPINKTTVNKIAIIGPSADVMVIDGGGSAYVDPFYKISPRQGLINKIGAAKVVYAKGCDINSTSTDGYGEALQAASVADYVVFVGGLDPSMEGEGYDRVTGSIDLPGKQQDLITQLAKINSKVIVVIKSGGVCGLQYCLPSIKGLLYAFYPGQEGGNAIADVIFGDYNPSGKLPVTLPLNDYQLPVANFNFNDDWGSGYRWFDKSNLTPSFVFGHGLSYTTFEYSNLNISPGNASIGSRITITADIKNIGSREGEEVVQLYISDILSSLPMPIKQLKGFSKINLLPGETRTVKFEITPEDLYVYDETLESYKVEAGQFTVKIGGSSANLPLSGVFEYSSGTLKSDLKISWIKTVPAYPVVGDTVYFLAGVVNSGASRSPNNSIHKVTFKINGTEIASSSELTESLMNGSMRMICSSPYVVNTYGEFNVEAIVDENNTIDEALEDNNARISTFKVYNNPPVNIALNKSVSVSSVESEKYLGQYAVDGSKTSRWASGFYDPSSMNIDLGEVKHFNRINIYWETAYSKDYTIKVSPDNTNWINFAAVVNGDGGLDVHTKSVDARYILFTGTKRATEWGHSIYEFEVYNVPDTLLDVKTNKEIPQNFLLNNNYPNPFNPETTLEYSTPIEGKITLSVYDVLGKKIAVLVDDYQVPGLYKRKFNGVNLSSGIYFYELIVRAVDGKIFRQNKKMILMK